VIGTTWEHPVFVRGKGWTKAGEVRPGDDVRLEAPGWKRVEAVVHTDRVEVVYNVEVEGDHTYFVGCDEWGFGVWAHNTCTAVQFAANKIAGRTAELTVVNYLRSSGFNVIGTQVRVQTSLGPRVLDVLVDLRGCLYAIEVKAGNAIYGGMQLTKDILIQNNGVILSGFPGLQRIPTLLFRVQHD